MRRHPVTPGKTVTIRYPDCTSVDDFVSGYTKHRITVKTIRDLVCKPLKPKEFRAKPYAAYTRQVVHAYDHELNKCRDFYIGLSKEYRSPSVLRVGAFDADNWTLLRLFDREYRPITQDREALAAALPLWKSVLEPGERLGIFVPDMRVCAAGC